MKYNESQLIEIYLDWVNNFLTLRGFSIYYGVTITEAENIISIGRILHENSIQKVA